MYILTRSGRQFSFTNPQPDMVAVEDVAHALSNINRFTGHTAYAYSVAQHCVSVSRYLELTGHPVIVQYAGLLHDAHEAYFGDISSPLKAFLGVAPLEDRIQAVVAEAFGLTTAQMHDRSVKLADLTALAVEVDHLMPRDSIEWDCLAPVTPDMKAMMPPPSERSASLSAWVFLDRFNLLQEQLRSFAPSTNRSATQ